MGALVQSDGIRSSSNLAGSVWLSGLSTVDGRVATAEGDVSRLVGT